MTRAEQDYWRRRAAFRAQCDANAGALRAYLESPAGRTQVERLDTAFRLLRMEQRMSDNEHGS